VFVRSPISKAKQRPNQTKGAPTLACGRSPLACPCHGFYTERTIMRCSSGPVSTSGECALRPAETVSVSQDKAHELFVHQVHHAQHGERGSEVRGDPTQPSGRGRSPLIWTRSRPDLAPLRFGQRARVLSAPRFGSGQTCTLLPRPLVVAATDRGRLGSFG
jgi:hypothetical protein